MGVSTPCAWNGIEYQSLSEAAQANGISVSSMYRRLQKGYTSNEDMMYPRPSHKYSIEWNGIKYRTVTEAGRANSLTQTGMLYRLRQGYTCDDDLKW